MSSKYSGTTNCSKYSKSSRIPSSISSSKRSFISRIFSRFLSSIKCSEWSSKWSRIISSIKCKFKRFNFCFECINYNSIFLFPIIIIFLPIIVIFWLVLTDVAKVISLTNASAITLTIPTNASVAFPTGTQILLYQGGAGQVTVGGAGVTIRAQGGKTKINAQYAVAALLKVGTDEWVFFGNTAA